MGHRLLPLLLMVATAAGCNGGAERQKQVEATLQRTLAAQSASALRHHGRRGQKALEAHPAILRTAGPYTSVDQGDGPAAANL